MKKTFCTIGLLILVVALKSESAFSQGTKYVGEVEIGEGSNHNFYGAGFVNYAFGKNTNGVACAAGFDLERVGPRQVSFTCGPHWRKERFVGSVQVGFSTQKEMAVFGIGKIEIKEREVEYFGDGRWRREGWWLRQRLTVQAWKQVFARTEGLLNSHEEERYFRMGPEIRKKISHGYVYGWGYLEPHKEHSLGYGLAVGYRF